MLDREVLIEAYELLNDDISADLQPIVKLAAALCKTPVAFITALGEDQQYFRAVEGNVKVPKKFSINHSFCRYGLEDPTRCLIVSDARTDERFSKNPFISKSKLVFYAGCPIEIEKGEVIGSLCVMDYRPRRLNKQQIETLKNLSGQLSKLLQLRREKIRYRHQINSRSYKNAPAPGQKKRKRNKEYVRNCLIENMQLNWNVEYYQFIGDAAANTWAEWRDRIHPQDRMGVLDSLEKVLRSSDIHWSVEYRYRKGNSEDFMSVKDRFFINRDLDLQPLSFTAVMTDIGEQKSRKQQLEIYESVINGTNDAILITEAEPLRPPYGPRIIFANKRIKDQTGYEVEEVIGKTPRLFQSPNVDKRKTRWLGEQLAQWKKIKDITLLNRKKSGEEFWVNLSIAPIADETGWFTHWISIQRDVTMDIAESRNKEVIADVQSIFNSPITLPKILRKVAQIVRAKTVASHVEFWIEGDSHKILEKLAVVSDGDRLEAMSNTRIFQEAIQRMIQKAKRTRETSYEQKPFGELNSRHRLFKLKDYKSFLIPMINGGKVIGVLVVLTNTQLIRTKRYLQLEFQNFDKLIGAEIGRVQLTGKYESLLNIAPDIICIAGIDGFFKEFNPAANEILGYSKKELLKASYFDLIHPEDRERTANEIKLLEKGKHKTLYFENRYKKKNGEYVWLAWSATPADEYGNMFCVAKVVSEVVKYRQQIQEHINRYNMAMEATTDAIWDFKIKENQLIWEEGFQRVFGYDKGLNYGIDTWKNKVHPDDVEDLMKRVAACFANHDVTIMENEYRFRHMNGEYRNVVDRSKILRDESGEPIRLVGGIKDITKRVHDQNLLMNLNRELQGKNQKLAISNAELEQFAYVTSHDLQEPLRMITGFLTQLERKYGNQLDEKAKTYIYYAVDGAKRMRKIILDLLEYNRVGRDAEDYELVDVNKVIEDLRQLYRSRIEKTDARIIIPKPLPVIKSREVQLSRIFQNLIDNAIKYRKKNVAPQIEIVSKEQKSAWYFEVKDNGVGIPKEYFDKVFVIFQRLSHEKTKGGTGMGLAITKKMVQDLGGEIEIDSTVNEGSKFMFTIAKP